MCNGTVSHCVCSMVIGRDCGKPTWARGPLSDDERAAITKALLDLMVDKPLRNPLVDR